MLCPCSNEPNFFAHTESSPPCTLLKAFAQFADSRQIQLSYMFASSFQVYILMLSSDAVIVLSNSAIFFSIFSNLSLSSLSFQKPVKFHVFAPLNRMTGQMTIATTSPISFQLNHHFRPLSILPMNSGFSDFFRCSSAFFLSDNFLFLFKYALDRRQNLILFIYSYRCA